MSFSNPLAKQLYLFMDSICSPVVDFFKDFRSELQEVWIHRNSPEVKHQSEIEPEEEKFNEKQALITLKSFKSIKKGTLLLFGIESSGKTSFLRRFSKKSYDDVTPTQGFNVQTLQFHGFVLTCWDFGGDKNLRIYWENYINEDISGILYILDGNDENKIQENLDVLILILNLVIAILGKPLPVLVFANKSDIGLKVNVVKFVEDVKTASNYDGIILSEEGSVHNWQNVEESMGYFMEFIK